MNENFPNCLKTSTKPDKYCPGCGHSIVLKSLGKVIDKMNIANKVMIGVDIGCSLLSWDYFDVPTIQTHHGRTIPVVSGYKTVEPGKIGIAYLGDGGGYAIGLQALIHAANRNDPITVVLVNNTVYGMTGGQIAPTTLCGEKTATSLHGKVCENFGNPFKGIEILSALDNNKMFLARTIVTKPKVLQKILEDAINNQINNKSFSFVEVLSMCPTNWRKNAKESIDYVENVMAKVFEQKVINDKK